MSSLSCPERRSAKCHSLLRWECRGRKRSGRPLPRANKTFQQQQKDPNQKLWWELGCSETLLEEPNSLGSLQRAPREMKFWFYHSLFMCGVNSLSNSPLRHCLDVLGQKLITVQWLSGRFTAKQLSCHIIYTFENHQQSTDCGSHYITTTKKYLYDSGYLQAGCLHSLLHGGFVGQKHLNALKKQTKALHAHCQPESKALWLQDHSFKMQILLAQSWINTDGKGGQVC